MPISLIRSAHAHKAHPEATSEVNEYGYMFQHHVIRVLMAGNTQP